MQTSGPSQTISISGTAVGLLDPTQPSRLLSSPDSKLSFATFNPRTASAAAEKVPSTHEELCNKKRVVVETLPNGESIWRWVPRAKGADNVADEGTWPRVINICGQLVECSQDQWDIYKLDPAYECFIPPQPHLTVITRRRPEDTSQAATSTFSEADTRKRHGDDIDDASEPRRKKMRPVVIDLDAEDSELDDDVVEEMIIDTSMPGAWKERRSLRKRRHDKAHQQQEKGGREDASNSLGSQVIEDLSMIDLTIDEPPIQNIDANFVDSGGSSSSSYPHTSSSSTAYSSQGSSSSTAHSFYPQPSSFSFPLSSYKRPIDLTDDEPDVPFKRARTKSPPRTSFKRTRINKRAEFVKKRQNSQKMHTVNIQARDREFEESIRAEAATWFSRASSQTSASQAEQEPGSSEPPHPQPPPPSEPEDPISLEEKIRRVAEINAYEEARRAKEVERLKAEQAAAEKRRKQEEQLLREKVKAERERQLREAEQERRRRQQIEDEQRRKREREAEARRAAQQQQQERWSYGIWTTQRALERYRVLSEAFDAAKFTPEDPVTFLAVPWPVLHRPSALRVEDVDWSAVEAFFKAVRPHMRSQEYKTLVEKSHRRFHPDRWRARRVLHDIQDDQLKACLEVAANTVAQALTPLWREVKGA